MGFWIMLPSVHDALRNVGAACRIRVQWQSRVLQIILLTATLDFVAASGANGQTINITNPMALTVPSTTNVGPGTAVLTNPTQDVFVAPLSNTTPGQPQPTLGITGATTSTGPASGPPTNTSGLVVNGGGTNPAGAGLTTNNQSNTAIKATVTDSNLSSSGHGVVWFVGPNAMLTASGGTWTGSGTPTNFASAIPPINVFPGLAPQEATVVTVQNGATADLSDMTLNLTGPDGFLPASKMALCVGGCGETGDLGRNIGGTAMLSNVAINVTSNNSAGIWVSRVSNVTVTDGSINGAGNNGQGVHADANGSMTLNDVPITMGGSNSLGVFAFTAAVANLGSTGTPTGTVTINGGSIIMTGPNSTGAMASGADSRGAAATVTLNGTQVATTGAGSNGLAVCIYGTPANGNAGPGAGGTAPSTVTIGGTIAVTNITVTTTGTGSNGAFGQDAGSISLTDSTVRLMQSGGGGSAYFANNGTITATNTTALTVGPNSNGGMLTNGGNLTGRSDLPTSKVAKVACGVAGVAHGHVTQRWATAPDEPQDIPSLRYCRF
jgi:hypothetical protein